MVKKLCIDVNYELFMTIKLDDEIDKTLLVAFINDKLDEANIKIEYQSKNVPEYEFTIEELDKIFGYDSYEFGSERDEIPSTVIRGSIIDTSNDVSLKEIQQQYMTN